MTLLELIQTVPPDKARIIDDILSYFPEPAKRLGLGNGEYNRDGPEGWDRNKLLVLSIEYLAEISAYLVDNNCEKWTTGYCDFTGKYIEVQLLTKPLNGAIAVKAK